MLAVTVLGCSGSYAGPGGACTGYLVQTSAANVWLDAGPGTLANLQNTCSLSELDAVVLTHAHPDHWLEIPVVANALKWYEKRDRLLVCSNAHMAAVARDVIGDGLDEVFDWRVVSVTDVVEIGDQTWRFAQTDHYVPTFAVRIDSDGRSMIFSSDTGPGFLLESLVGEEETIDLALIESTFLDRVGNEGIMHLSATEAGALAQSRRINRLVLTHLAPHEDASAHVAAAGTKFSGRIDLAEVGRAYPAAVD